MSQNSGSVKANSPCDYPSKGVVEQRKRTRDQTTIDVE